MIGKAGVSVLFHSTHCLSRKILNNLVESLSCAIVFLLRDSPFLPFKHPLNAVSRVIPRTQLTYEWARVMHIIRGNGKLKWIENKYFHFCCMVFLMSDRVETRCVKMFSHFNSGQFLQNQVWTLSGVTLSHMQHATRDCPYEMHSHLGKSSAWLV